MYLLDKSHIPTEWVYWKDSEAHPHDFYFIILLSYNWWGEIVLLHIFLFLPFGEKKKLISTFHFDSKDAEQKPHGSWTNTDFKVYEKVLNNKVLLQVPILKASF